MTALRVALVHERFTDIAGSEHVVQQMRKVWPNAAVCAPIADTRILPPDLHDVQTSPLQRIYGGGSYAQLLPLLPLAMGRLPLPQHDLVVTSHHAFANRVVHATNKPVISYVHSPARWMWDAAMRRGEVGGRAGLTALALFSATQRGPDRRAAQKLAAIMANSTAVAQRVDRWWGRSSEVVFPPVDVDFYHPAPEVEREGFVLLAGRLVPYKRPELAVRAAQLAGVRLVVAGDGRALDVCMRAASSKTDFVGRVDDAGLRDLYRRATVVIMPGIEDFGIIPVEAQACGTPVVAQAAGGALDTVVPGSTGVLVSPEHDDDHLVEGLAAAIQESLELPFDPVQIRKHAETFSADRFRARLTDFVARKAT